MSFWEFFFLLLIFVPLLMLWIFTLGDLAARRDISGLARGLWAVAVVLLPVIGMLIYFVTRPDGARSAAARDVMASGTETSSEEGSVVDQLEQLAHLHESGVLTVEQFSAAKATLIEAS